MPTFGVQSNEPDQRTYSSGDAIFTEGEHGDFLYYILEGKVELRRQGRLLNTLGEGEIFGEMALLDDSPRSASAVAKESVKASAINQKRFLQMLAGTPFFAVQVMQVMAERLRHKDES